MACPYAENPFCRSLPEKLRAALCAMCHVKRYARGQCLRENYWAGYLSLMLEGMAAEVEQSDADGRLLATGLCAAGDFFNMDGLFSLRKEARGEALRDTFCMTDCALAVFPVDGMLALMDEEPQLTRLLLKNCVTRAMPEKKAMLRSLGYGSAEESIRYILEYLQRNEVGYLTHEQIALLSNRSRQTVTLTLKALTEQSPELFTGKN